MGVCFLHALPPHDASPTDSSSDPRITEFLDAYGDVFKGPHGVVPDRPIRHEIILEDGAVPPRGCIYRMSEEELSVLRAQLDDLLEKRWIRPSSSPYGAPVLFVRKKNKDLRLCIDYRKLNAQTIRNADPLPHIDDLPEPLGGAKFFSKLDLKSRYHQLEIRKEDCYKTAFKTRYGHFEWLVMPFGLTNAPAFFQAAMTTEFRHMQDRFVLIYLDDILVYSRSLDEHVEYLRTVLERLRQTKYKANHDKCEFARQELEYLGHYVTPQAIRPLADKIEALRVWPEPTNTTDVRSFMGLAGYYQRFITEYSRIVAPMTRLQSPKVPFVFDDDARRSFLALKTTMLMAPVLSIYDPTLPTGVTTDASGYGIGAVLEQHDNDDWHPVEYFSHKVPPINSLDDARKKELLAFMMALKRWQHFLFGRRRFTWVTDNNPLTYYKTQDTVSSTIGRWMYFIDQFDFTPKHLPGLSNRAADAHSRRPDLCAMTHHAFAFDEELQRHFIRGYESDQDFAMLYAQLSSDHLPASHYRIVDGYLLIHSRGKDLLCVPRDRRLRTRLLGEYHDSRLAGHFGVNRTIARLRQRFRWPDLITDVTRYCDSCEVCRRSKPRNRNPYGKLRPMPIPREPGLSIAMDVTGPFPRDRLGHDGILTVGDRLSKYARFLPCKYYFTDPELARLLHTGWICGHGVPEDIVGDHDTRFMSAFWTVLMQESGTKMKPSSARYPQTDGQTERVHQTAQMMLRTLIRPDQKDWVDRLPDIEFAYNTSVHPAIGVTPFELHHGGRKGRIFADLLLPRPADINAACSPASVRKYRELLAEVCANMQKVQVRMQQQANRRRLPCPIRAGDLVCVSAEEFALEHDVSRKLLPKWFGPWPVTSAAGDEPDDPSFVINIPTYLTERALGRLKEQLRARRRRKLTQDPCDGAEYVATPEAVVQLCYALGCGVIPRATPRWWVKRRTGGTWENLRPCDDATDDYFRDKLRMLPRVFREIAEACAPHLQQRVTFYREPLQPDQIVVYALHRWASGETYESSTCNFGIGRASGLIAVRDVTAALLRMFGEKIAWPTGLRKLVVLRAFANKGFPNCHGCIDCTHVYIDKPANAPSENYYDRKRRFSIVTQVVVDLDLRVLDVLMGYPGSCHDIRVLQLSSLSLRAEEGSLFRGPPVTLPFGVKMNGYVLADNGYPPSEWMVVPYGGINQHVDEERFDNKQKVARGAVERAFGRLKGMWRLFLRIHKTNLDTLPQQFTVVCILHNMLIGAGIPFDENLLWEVDANGVRQRVDLGIEEPL
ncbi:hypothetical protein CBR_g27824 [Chara braunii]|uniref:Integrase catalytic domain-containing protein n=1 Tax=Chara braunii TaxID=69332 RepID=A0A388L8F7_CHABU|nr:hypothetical protein CBR_g27824 [Chara braunii]|eukprot:GBG78599.1 hypothetical protein CBR_g27824 [Chara braunii]